jgi:uncharacterized membrane-anchored protein YhcB (DUF1043 family)
MPPDLTTVSYLFPRISAFARTKTFIAVAAFIVGVNIGIIIAGYEHRQVLSALQEKIDANKAQLDANQAKIDANNAQINSMKGRIDNIKGPSDQQK